LISTKTETPCCPSAFVIVQGGPFGTHPVGVEPGVSQRLASPGLAARIPGLKMLPLSVAPFRELF
jgi:hypothetical protein